MSTPSRPLRILLMGDASNYHRCLATGLRRMGHEVTVASNGSRWMDTSRDIDISRRPGRINGLLYWLDLWRRRRLFSGYDIVQLCGPCFIEQRPARISQFLDYLKRNNGSVFMTALGTDCHYMDMCLAPDSPLRYSDWAVYGTPTPYACSNREAWGSAELRDHTRHVYDSVDGIATALYEYDLSVRRHSGDTPVVYTGIPVDTASIEYPGPLSVSGPVRLFLGAHAARMAEKGTDRLLEAARTVVDRHPGLCVLDHVYNLPYDRYLSRMRMGHVILDQLYSYTPATNALLAMAMGIPVVSGGESEYYDFIGEHELRPVINVLPDDGHIVSTLEQLVLNPGMLTGLSAQGREFVIRHNDVDVVAARFVKLWQQ